LQETSPLSPHKRRRSGHAISDIGALRPPGRGPCSRVPVPCYIGDFNHQPGGPFMRATRLVSLVVPLLVVPGLAAAQSRSFTYERGIDRPGHAYRVLETHNAADCSLACQAANSCRAWTYVKPGAPRRAGTASRCWLKHVVPRPIRNDCCTSGVRKRSASHVDH
jgi:hypothetical protein